MGIEGVGEEPLIPLSHGSSEKESDIVHKNSIGEISERSAAPFPTCLRALIHDTWASMVLEHGTEAVLGNCLCRQKC